MRNGFTHLRGHINVDSRGGRKLISFIAYCFVCDNEEGFMIGSFMWIDTYFEDKGKEWTNMVAKAC